jgi:hypothetical protein
MATGGFIPTELCELTDQQKNLKYYYVAVINRDVGFAGEVKNITILSGR